MNRKPVSSSNIRSAGFENGEMHIEFTNGKIYSYTGPKAQAHYDALVSAPSPGSYFHKHVRSCPHTTCKLVDAVLPAKIDVQAAYEKLRIPVADVRVVHNPEGDVQPTTSPGGLGIVR